MQELLNNITDYVEYLQKECGLSVSVHFSDEKLRSLPESVFSRLLPYNIHRNPYCGLVKKTQWKTCMKSQQKILKRQTEEISFCSTCYAGVTEYIRYMKEKDGTGKKRIAGYVAVSGYRTNSPVEKGFDLAGWERYLNPEEIPRKFCDTVIPPLCHMFELLFAYPMETIPGDEYPLILQFINERHGQITLEELCQQFGRSKSYISHMFNERCGMTLRAYCNDLKLEYARMRLSNLSIPITEIAMDAGYNDVSYFIQLFKEKYDMTPLKYRKLCGGKEN